MSMEHSPGAPAPSTHRGPSVDLDPNGIVAGRGLDRQRRQFPNHSFYRLDPMFTCAKVPIDATLAQLSKMD